MPTKTTKIKSKTTVKKGGLLSKKVGPVPVVVLVGIGAVILFLVYRSRRSSSNATGIDTTSTVTPTTTVTPQQAASAGAPASGGSSFDPSQLEGLFNQPTDYVTSTDLQSQLDSLGSNLASQVAGITFPPVNVTVQTPTVKAPVSRTPVKAPQKVSPTKSLATATHYFTYKKDVHLAHGQTLHFTKGKGYYAA